MTTLLVGLLQGIERITDAALTGPTDRPAQWQPDEDKGETWADRPAREEE